MRKHVYVSLRSATIVLQRLPATVRSGQRWVTLALTLLVCIVLGPASTSCVAAQETEARPDAAPSQTLSPQQPAETTPDAPPAASETPPEDPRRITAKVVRYAQRLVRTYDRNGNGQLEQQEWQTMHGNPREADLNHDGVITVEELARYVMDFGRHRRIRLLPPQPGDLVELPPLLNPTTAQPAVAAATQPAAEQTPASGSAAAQQQPASEPPKKELRRRDSKFYVPSDRLPRGLPDWFLARDRDGDGQLTISEFSPKGVASELQQFKQLDRDEDGVLTAAECAAQGTAERKKAEKTAPPAK